MFNRGGKSDILAVSEVLGNILLVVNSIVIAGAIYAMFMGYSMSLPEAQATFEFDYYEDTDVMNITMTSGNSISSGEIIIYQYHQDILMERYELGDYLDDINNNGKWDTGEICSVTLGRELEEGDELSVYDRSNDRVVDEFVYTLTTVAGGIDLKISAEDIIIQKSEVFQNDVNVQITAWVFNIGSEDAEDDINVMFRNEFQGINRLVGMATIGGGIPAGETKAATILWTPSNLFGENCVGIHEIKVQVLPYRGENNVANNDAETNEYVRIYTAPVTVPEEPDLSITSLDVSYTPELPQRGDNIYVRGIIVNLGSTYATCTVEIYDGDVEDSDHDGELDTSPLPPRVVRREDIYVREISDFLVVWDNATGGLHNLSLVVTDVVSDEPSLEEDNYANNIAMKQVFVKPKILIVDDDNSSDTSTLSDSTRFLRNSVNAIGYSYDFYYVSSNRLGPVYESEYSSVELRNYDVVIWQTGFEDNNTLQSADVDNLTRYLDSGGKLWVIGTDILDDFVYNDDVQGKDFLTRYCGVNMSTVERNFELQAINGTLNPYLHTSDMACSVRSVGPQFQRSDNFTVVANQTQGWTSHAVFHDGISDRYSIASANYNQSNGGKALFFSFDIAMFSSPAYRAQTVYKVMKWFGTALRGEMHDLAVVDVQVSPENPKYMDDLTISVIVQNNGNLMENEVKLAFYANDMLIPEYPYGDQNIQTIYNLDGNGTLSATLQKRMLLVDPGEIEITVRVDPFDAITEISETNNDASYSTELDSSILVGNNILVVDDDNATAWPHDVTGNITRSLNYLGYDFTKLTYTDGSDGPNLDTLKSYNIVIWCTGNETDNTLTDNDLIAVADYLEGDFNEATYFRLETHLVLIGQGILNDLISRGETTFIHQYLHVDTTSLGMDVGIPDPLTGVRNNEITHGLSYDTDPVFEDGGDAVVPRGGARGIFRSFGGRYSALSYDWNDVGGDLYKLIFMPAELSFVSSGVEDGDRWMHQCEFLYLGLKFLGYGDERLELTTADVDIQVNEIHPVLGRSYTLTAKIYNHGNERESVIVRFMDGNTILKSVSTTVIEGSNTSVDFIWAPLFAGPRTLWLEVDPDDDKPEIFDELNNRAQYGTYVYFFYDDMENGTGNWDHDATILRINGEDYSGVEIVPMNVLITFVIDDSKSMTLRSDEEGNDWLTRAKDAAKTLLDGLSDDSVCVSIWDFKGNHERRYSGPDDRSEPSGEQVVVRDPVVLGDDYGGIDGRTLIRNEIEDMENPSGTTILWDAIGEGYMDTMYYAPSYTDLQPVVVVLSDGTDAQASDQSPLGANKIEGGSDYWCPWNEMVAGEQTYTLHRGKYTFDWSDPVNTTQWLRAMDHGGSMDYTRTGLLYSDIPIYTIGLGLEHHEPPNEPEIVTWPGEVDDYTNAYCSDPITEQNGYRESGTLEYNLWRIADTSGAKYFYAPSGDQLDDVFRQVAQHIGNLVTRGQDTRDGSVLEYMDPPIFSHINRDWLDMEGFHVTGEVNNTNMTRMYHSLNTSYFMHEYSAGGPNPWSDGTTENDDKYLEAPPVNLTGIDSADLTFYHKYYLKDDTNGMVLMVGTPVNPSNPYGAYRYRYIVPEQPYSGNIMHSEWGNKTDDYGREMRWCWNGKSESGKMDWEYKSISLDRFIGNWVKIRFYYIHCTGGTGYGWAVDDVEVKVTRSDTTRVNEDTEDQWQWVSDDAHSGDHSWWCGVPDTRELGNGIDNSLYTRPIDLTLAVNATLEAYMKFNIPTEAGRPPDGFRVEVSTDSGKSWLPLVYGVRAAWNVSGSEPDSGDGTIDGKSYSGLDPDGDGWVKASTLTRVNVNLDGFIGNVIVLRFRVVTTANDLGQGINPYYGLDHIADPGAGFGGFYLDDVYVYGWSQTTSRACADPGPEATAGVGQGEPGADAATTSDVYQPPEVETSLGPEERLDVEVSGGKARPVPKQIDEPQTLCDPGEKRVVETSDDAVVKDSYPEAKIADIAWKKDKYQLGDMVSDAL